MRLPVYRGFCSLCPKNVRLLLQTTLGIFHSVRNTASFGCSAAFDRTKPHANETHLRIRFVCRNDFCPLCPKRTFGFENTLGIFHSVRNTASFGCSAAFYRTKPHAYGTHLRIRLSVCRGLCPLSPKRTFAFAKYARTAFFHKNAAQSFAPHCIALSRLCRSVKKFGYGKF